MIRVSRPEISASVQINLHAFQPARRNTAHVRQNSVRGTAINRNKVVPTTAPEQRCIRQRYGVNPWQASQMFRRLVPKLYRLRIPRDRIENENLVGRKAGGLIRQAFERSDEDRKSVV